mgnify:CR=1 FL=1
MKIPPSLQNIFRELFTDLRLTSPQNGNLEYWAKQGVLMLNSSLTVEKGIPGSHSNKGWEIFTDNVIKLISKNKRDIVFMLWGGYSKKKEHLINKKNQLILKSGHPSPLSANRGLWFGNKHFSKCNDFLSERKLSLIKWC